MQLPLYFEICATSFQKIFNVPHFIRIKDVIQMLCLYSLKPFTVKSILLLFAILCGTTAIAQTPEEKLSKLNIELPKIGEPMASYVHYVRVGNLLYLSGKGPQNAAGEYTKGKLGKDLTIEEGYAAAKLTAINQIAVLKQVLGDLSKVKRIVKVNGFVNSDADFYDHPKVINGFSDLMVEVFGEKGRHARTSLGVTALPVNMAVEIEVVVEIE